MLLFVALLRLLICCHAVSKQHHVYPRILQERSTTGNLVVELGENITLNLQRSTVLAENLLFITSSKGLHEVETIDTSEIQANIYHDTHYQSSLMVRKSEGNVEVEGIINDNLRIRPLPAGQRSTRGQMLHKIFEIELTKENLINTIPQAPRLRKTNNHKKASGSPKESHPNKPPASSTGQFPVELHIISDQDHQREYKTNTELIAYLAIMLNAANLRYLDMANPKITFLLVGVTRSKDHVFAKNRNGEIEAGEMLTGLNDYTKQGNVPGKHDVVYLMTGLDMIKFDNGKKSNDIAGRAYISVVCTKGAVGEGEDKPHTYIGVNTLAHELAHTLGSKHDETPECPWSEGYLMSYVDGGLRKYRLSKCTEKAIRKYVGELSQECIKVSSEHNYSKDYKKFPGQTVREHYFCKKLLKDKANGQKISVRKPALCYVGCCAHFVGYVTCYKYKMLDGMTCAGGKTCKRGVCGVHDFYN